jgi:dihydrodipicolinate synthase/N-acetylneuraminate lyase
MIQLDTVFAVPPLPRKTDARRTIDLDAAEQVARHIEAGGITHLLYGGNAFLYHATTEDFDTLVGWLASMPAARVPIPSIGPSFGRAMDQARVIARHRFQAAMMLPCGDPRDPKGLEAGYRDIAQAAGIPLIIYLKSEDAFGPDRAPGLEAIGRLIDDEVAIAIKYAVVLPDPKTDSYLGALLWRIDNARVVSGMGERPAIAHLKDFKLAGMTTGSGCIAPRTCRAFYDACRRGDWTAAERLREHFMPLEDLRDELGPARVLHHATECAGIAPTGPIPPYISPLAGGHLATLAPVARSLKERDSQ